jgi:hypothetical protein
MKARALFMVCMFIGLCAITSTPAAAQAVPERRLKVSPVRSEIVVQAGSVFKGTLKLENSGKSPLNVTLDAEAFNIVNQQYDYVFLPKSPINDWVHFTQDAVVIDPGQSYLATYFISVPNGTEPGGKYISLFASAQPSEIGGINTVNRVGSLLYMTIPGAITKTGALLSLRSPLVGTDVVSWSATIQNSGTAHFRSHYTVALSTLWNMPIAKSSDSSLVLPASVRLLSGDIPHPSTMGIYNVNYTFELGDTSDSVQTKLLIYLPLTQVLPTIGALIVIIVLVYHLVRIRKKKMSRN